MSALWTAPTWMKSFLSDVSENPVGTKEGLEAIMTSYGKEASTLISTPAGREVSVNAQIGLLVRLHAQGRLCDPPPKAPSPDHKH